MCLRALLRANRIAVPRVHVGSEDLTPSEFYRKADAQAALEQASLVVRVVSEDVT